ncbi:MAG: HAMP domain-containing histidine kinase [Chloroflexi bacterium]|nr:HAMP domain-containing histidine kinase [Chloroflexota bacterium]
MRWRLTLFYAGLMLVLVSGLGIFVYSQLDGFLIDSSANRLSYETAPKLSLGPAVKTETNTDTRALLQRLNTQIQTLNSQTIYATTYDANGQVVSADAGAALPQDQDTTTETSSNQFVSMKSPPAASQFEAARLANNYHYVEESNNSNRLVVLIIPVTIRQLVVPAPAPPPIDKKAQTGGPDVGATTVGVSSNNPSSSNVAQPSSPDEVAGFVVVAQPLFEADQILGQLRLILLLGATGTVIIILLLGLPVARFGLAPLKKMTLTAQRIAGGDLTQRVALKPLNARKSDKEAGGGIKGTDDEVRQLTVAFNQMLDRIEAAFSAQRRSEARTRRFVADASHELRTPLTTLGGSLDVLMMQAKNLPPQTQKFLNTMQREIDRLTRLVVNLLQLTRLDAGGTQVVHPEPVRLDTLIDQTFEGLSVLAGERHLNLENNKITGEGNTAALTEEVWVQADSDRLRQVLTNLIDNAIRYTAPDGTITLRAEYVSLPLTTTTNAVEKNWVKLEVADNGAGIPQNHLSHIFDRFYRADGARVGTGTNSNAGLGLSIVQAIIEAHGGQITVASEVGKGTIFTIYLPAATTSYRGLMERY